METEAERWQREALANIRLANAYLSALLRATMNLIALTEIHRATDFGHCDACHTPWPCATADLVKQIGEIYVEPQSE